MNRTVIIAIFLAVLSPAWALSATVEVEAPIRRSLAAADVAKTPPGAVALTINGLSELWNASSVRLSSMPMPDGDNVTLLLTRQANPVEATWFVTQDSLGREQRSHLPAAPVLLLAGTVEGDPGSAVFLGLAENQAQGWIETSEGLHLISTSPEGGPTLMFRVGADRGGIDLPAPGLTREIGTPTINGQPRDDVTNPFVPVTDYDRLLLEMQNPDSPLRELVMGERVRRFPDFLDGANRAIIQLDPIVGACCVLPGFCFQLTAEGCADFCESPDDFCDNVVGSDPDEPYSVDNPPQCWLGPGVPCDERWVCFESFDDPSDPDHPGNGNWFGACCIEDPLDPGMFDIVDLSACECGYRGGRFVIEPAVCLGDDLAAPGQMPADNFVSAAEIIAIDPFFCSSAPGACCIEQQVLCEDFSDDPQNPILEYFKEVACISVPQAICEDADIITDSFNGTGQAGYWTKECFPCVFSANVGGATEGQAFICPATMQNETSGGVHAPPQTECQYAQLTVDTDSWYLDRFDGDVQAGQRYATLLMASVNWILERDALVSFQIGDLILRGADDADPVYYVAGACCFGADCYENQTEAQCPASAGATWLGPGTSCQDFQGVCTPDPVIDPDINWSIVNTYAQMASEWNLAASDPDHQFYDIRTSSNFILLLSGFSYERPYFSDSDTYPGEFGVETQDVAAGVQRTLCVEGASPYAVAAVRGTFPWPGTPFGSDNSNWDLVAAVRALGLGIGVNETSSYGYDRCFGPPCEGVSVSADCTHQYFNSGLYTDDVLPINTDAMPPTLMSYCASCPGGSSNLQLRFRSEIGARIYSRFANMDCSWSGAGGLDPNEPNVPYASDDFYINVNGVSQYLDVMANDVAPGCAAQYDDPTALFPMELSQLGVFDAANPTEPDWQPGGSGGLPGATILGGTIDIVDDPNNPAPDANQVVLYTPPADFCGVDVFEYEIETIPPVLDPPVVLEIATARVQIVQQGCTNALTVCPPCYESVTEPTVPATPPVPPYSNDVMVINDVAGSLVDSFSWSGLQLTLADTASTSPQEAFLRVWLSSEAGVPIDPNSTPPPFFDVHPFGTQAECGPTPDFVWNGSAIVSSSGTCIAPVNLFVPPSGEILVQCLEESDDLPGADATWTGGEVCVVSEPTNATGACCLDGLCYETTAYDCIALDWSYQWEYDVTSSRWDYRMVQDKNASGFFMGAGTTCTERDWCRRTAPCCFLGPDDEMRCAELTCEECRDIGGTLRDVLGNTVFNGTEHCDVPGGMRIPFGAPRSPQILPLWDTPCEFPVCDTPPSYTVGACCMEIGGARFCSDLTRIDCEDLGGTWSIRGRCDQVPCTPLGACCTLTANGSVDSCVDGIDAQACQLLWDGVPLGFSVVFHSGETCNTTVCDIDATGACCLADQNICCDSFTREVCDLVYGTFLGSGSDCTTCSSAAAAGGACSIVSGDISVCTIDLAETVCQNLGGQWYGGMQTCNEGVPGPGIGFNGLVGACCYEFECVGSVSEMDCIVAGGHLIAKADNPWHPGCEPTATGPLWGSCCYDNTNFGRVCIDQPNQTACESLPGGSWCGAERCEFQTGACGAVCPSLNLCAPGLCTIELGSSTGQTNYFIETIAADRQRCDDRGGVWGGPVTAAAFTPRVAGDLDGDGTVGPMDLLRLLAAWGSDNHSADLDGSGYVDVNDLRQLLSRWR